jgi:hypothetical protein
MSVILDTGAYRYEVGDDWAKSPPRWTSSAAGAAAGVDTQDRVCAFSRGRRAMIVMDRGVNVLRSKGQPLTPGLCSPRSRVKVR